MKRVSPLYICLFFGCAVFGATETKVKVEKTMSVNRCQAILESGRQCPNEAPRGEACCWKHRGVVKVLDDTVTDAGKGAGKTWQSTKTWSTNAWESAKSGARRAMDATAAAFEEARTGMNDLLGGKDDEKKQHKTRRP